MKNLEILSLSLIANITRKKTHLNMRTRKIYSKLQYVFVVK